MPYEFLEDIATADIAFRAWGKNLEETFQAAADATMNVMIEDLNSIRHKEERTIRLENEALDMLLFNLLQEIIFFKDSEGLLLRVTRIEIARHGGVFSLAATASGEKLDPEVHRQRVDVKAVTLHRFALEQTARGWEASVILDI
ncbi:MAG TPA: archease [Candidatus Acidoferrales bacterium]|nr:archease [Candidatus Acidoferrales bacterium]